MNICVDLLDGGQGGGNYMYPPMYYNHQMPTGGGMFYAPYSQAPMFYSAPVQNEGTLQDFIKKQM